MIQGHEVELNTVEYIFWNLFVAPCQDNANYLYLRLIVIAQSTKCIIAINPNNSRDSLDRSKLRPSQVPKPRPTSINGNVICSNMHCLNGGGWGGGVLRLARIFCGTFCPRPNGQFLVLGAPFQLFQIGAVYGGKNMVVSQKRGYKIKIWGPFQIISNWSGFWWQLQVARREKFLLHNVHWTCS